VVDGAERLALLVLLEARGNVPGFHCMIDGQTRARAHMRGQKFHPPSCPWYKWHDATPGVLESSRPRSIYEFEAPTVPKRTHIYKSKKSVLLELRTTELRRCNRIQCRRQRPEVPGAQHQAGWAATLMPGSCASPPYSLLLKRVAKE
jgi:hypothetical protein